LDGRRGAAISKRPRALPASRCGRRLC
jgi:hypothetical protein